MEARWIGAQLLLRWPADVGAFVLEQTDALPAGWEPAPGAPIRAGDHYEQRESIASGCRFFRLRQLDGHVTAVLGLVQSATGEPLVNAQVGQRQLSDAEGVFAGLVEVTPGGWMTLRAAGHATGYARPASGPGGTALVEAWLTPFAIFQRVESGQTARLFLGDAAVPRVEVTLEGADFASNRVTVGLCELKLPDVGPLAAPLEPADDRHLTAAFSMEAFDSDGNAVSLAAERQVEVRIRDDGGTNTPPLLAWFDADAGKWRALPAACERAGPNRLTCHWPATLPLCGLFEAGPAPRFDTTGPGLHGRTGGSQLHQDPSAAEAAFDEDYKRHRARLQVRLRELEGVGDPTQDAETHAIMADMAAQARAYAAAYPNERGKVKLLNAAYQAGLLGEEALMEQLHGEATQLANDLARSLLGKGDCGRVREMLHMEAQLQLMGGDEALIEGLRQKIEQLYQECDLWIGTIQFTGWPSPSHPGLKPYVLQSGGSWSERHEVKMATHAKTRVLTGEDFIKLDFPEVVFEKTDDPCEQSITFFGRPTPASLTMNFGGSYDGRVFQVSQLVPATGAQPVSVVQRWVIQGEEDGGCITIIPGQEFPFPNYYTLIWHGFDRLGPPITIQEMLDGGTRSAGPFGEVIRGYEQIQNGLPFPNAGRYPFTSGWLTWQFIHVKKLLPLEP